MKKIHVSEFVLVALCFCSVIIPGHLFSGVMSDDEIDAYFAARVSIVGASKVDSDKIGIPKWIKHKQALGYLVIPGYYAAELQTGGYNDDGSTYQQDIIDASDRALWNWNEGVEYFTDNDISTVTDHNFSDNISNEIDHSYPEEADDLYWTKFLPLGSQCYIIDRIQRKVTVYELINRYEEREYANAAYHVNYDLDEEIKPKYKKIGRGNLLMETCDIDATDENPHIWITEWERK